jgi:type II secretory pathway pseudopilin PulG
MLRPPFNPSLPGFSRKKTAGFTLIEVAIASVLVAMLGTGVLMFITDQLRTSEAQASGTALSALNTAVGNYEATYSINLSNHTAIPIPGFANVANPYSPTTTELTELGFLKYTVPAGTYGIAINPTVVNGTPSGLVWILKPFTTNLGGASQDLAAAAMISAGGDAAISTVANPSVVAGVDGWNAANPQGSVAAIVAMRNGAGSAAFVRLDGSTPMQGSLNLGGYNVTNASTVSAATVAANTVTASGNITGGNVAAAGAITAQNYITAANYVSSNGNIYAGQNISANGNTSGSTLTATANGNDVFFGSSALYSDGWNAVVRTAGGALYAQNMGGGAVPVVASQLVTPAGNGVQIGSSYYYGDGSNSAIRQNGQLYIQNQAGSGAASLDAQRVTAEEYVQINGQANQGWGCSPNGLQGRDGSGNPLFCVNGVWTQPSSGSLKFGGTFEIVWVGNGPGYGANPNDCWQANPLTGNCTCPPGYNEMIIGMTFHYTQWDGAGAMCWAYNS